MKALTHIAAVALLSAALLPAQAGAEEQGSTTTTPAPASTPSTPPTSSAPSTPPAEPTKAGTETTTVVPQVEAQHVQSVTPGAHAHKHAKTQGSGVNGQQAQGSTSGAPLRLGHSAPAPSTPALPFNLVSSIAGVPGFFIESFQIPPFLLPIYQAAGTAYSIPWQVLAAINEVETDYGRDLSISSAGAEGWMQFLPSEWAQYGVNATGAGFKDPYNPADAIFAAARYLHAAGGARNIKAAIYSYNHSQAYVESVMLRAQLLSGTPPELLGAVTGLTEAEFPVHAPSHFSDGFQTLPASGSSPARELVGTTIYSQAGAPVIAVQDGEIVQVGESPTLGRFVSLRDGYGNTYVYAQLGSVATLYPVLEPHEQTAVSTRISHSGATGEPAPSGPATAGAQPRSLLSEGAAVSALALGAAAQLESLPSSPSPASAKALVPARPVPAKPAAAKVRVFREGPDDVYLHPLTPGAQVIAGTVLGHVGAQATGAGEPVDEPHMLFQIRPTGVGAPLIDPKPILDGWVALENTSIFRAKGENPFLQTSPTVGQVLLESKQQLEQQVAHDQSIHMRACARRVLQTGRVDQRVLAALEFLSVSGLKPTVSGLRCTGAAPASEDNVPASSSATVKITQVNGIPIAGHQAQGSIADTTVRKLLTLQGINKPRKIVSLLSYPSAASAVAEPSASDYIKVVFGPLGSGGAHAASAFDSVLTPNEWIKLIARLGEIPDPTVASGPSAAAIPDNPPTNGPVTSGALSGEASSSNGGETGGNG